MITLDDFTLSDSLWMYLKSDIIDEYLRDIIGYQDSFLKKNVIEQNDENSSETCKCEIRNFQGMICECLILKENIRTLLALSSSLDGINVNMNKALRISFEEMPMYSLVNMICQANVKSVVCLCETEDVHSIPEIKIKIIHLLHLDLLVRNRQIEENAKETSEILSSSQKQKKTINLDSSFHELLDKCLAIQDKTFQNIPRISPLEEDELKKNRDACRILPKQSERLLLKEEIIKELLGPVNQAKTIQGGRSVSKKKKKCSCRRTEVEIEILKDFKRLITKLHPVKTIGVEVDLGPSEDELRRRTIGELIKDKKPKSLFSKEFLKKHGAFVAALKKNEGFYDEERMIKDLLNILYSSLVIIDMKLKEDEEKLKEKIMQNPKLSDIKQKFEQTDANYKMLIEEKEFIDNLIFSLKNYLGRVKEKLIPIEEKYWLLHLNSALRDLLKKQQDHLKRMDELVPGFIKTLFVEVHERKQIVEELCKDEYNESDYQCRASAPEIYDEERKTLRELLTAIMEPYDMNFPSSKKIGKISESEISEVEEEIWEMNNDEGKIETNNEEVEANKVSFLLPPKFGREELWNNLSKEIRYVLGVRRNKNDIYWHNEVYRPNLIALEKDWVDRTMKKSCNQKAIDRAYVEGWKIATEPEPPMVIHENLAARKRLLHELNLEKRIEQSQNVLRNREEMKMKLKQIYNSKDTRKCKCKRNLRKLLKLKGYIEDFFTNPEKHQIIFEGPMTAMEFVALENARKFLTPKKQDVKVHKPKFKLNDRLLRTTCTETKDYVVYEEKSFDIVWGNCGLDGMFMINLEAQMMENERIIIRPQYEKRVKVMSGGRTSMELLYGEFVCYGMLDAVVLGTNADGPTPRSIFQTILELDSGQGVIVIILNEFEDRLSFQFAIERACKAGVDVRLVLARDDVSNDQPNKERHGLRGNSGIILQYKVAAGMAMKGHNLNAISRVTQNMQIATMGCIFGSTGAYIGSGIREEEQGCFYPSTRSHEILYNMLNHLLKPTSYHSIAPEPGTNIIILLNKFSLTTDEAYSLLRAVGQQLMEFGANVERAYHSSFSSFEGQGFSITLAKDWNNDLIPFLDLPTTCIHWPPHLSGMNNIITQKTTIHKDLPLGAKTPSESISVLHDILDRVLKDARSSIKTLSTSNIILSRGMLETVLKLRPQLDLKQLDLDRPYLLFKYVGKLLRNNLRWHGKLFHLFFLAASQEFLKDPDYTVTWMNWCRALRKGTQAVAGYTKYKVGQGTIIDFLEPVTQSLCRIKKGWSPLTFLFGGLEKVKATLENKEYNLGLQILNFVFKHIYDVLLERMGHYKGDEWWKVTPFPKILLVDPLNKEVSYAAIPEEMRKKIRKKEAEMIPYSEYRNSDSADENELIAYGASLKALGQESEEEYSLNPSNFQI